jgi:hypothetical protein
MAGFEPATARLRIEDSQHLKTFIRLDFSFLQVKRTPICTPISSSFYGLIRDKADLRLCVGLGTQPLVLKHLYPFDLLYKPPIL